MGLDNRISKGLKNRIRKGVSIPKDRIKKVPGNGSPRTFIVSNAAETKTYFISEV
jgi:hypothetical protein